jgi:putative endonuclease
MVRCNDNSLYTGITTNIEKRLRQHNDGPKGARYTRSRRPVTMVYCEQVVSRSAALSREYQIKNITTCRKQQLIAHNSQHPQQGLPNKEQL